MKIIKILIATFCLVWVPGIFIFKEIEPQYWPVLGRILGALIWISLILIWWIVETGMEQEQKEIDKYFEDKT